MTQNFTPPPNDGIQRGSGRANPFELIPFLGFLAFLYMGMTIATPDRLPWEQPAKATDGNPPAKPQCIASNPSPGVFTWKDCPAAQATDSPKFFNTLTQRWE